MIYTELYIRNRLSKLATNPTENAKLIKKWERILRKYTVAN